MKKNTLLKVAFYSIILLIAGACKKASDDQFFLWVDPVESIQEKTAGSIMTFTITASSDVPIMDVSILEKENDDFTRLIADSVPNRNKLVWQFEYRIPLQKKENELVYLFFEATDQNGNQAQVPRIIHVITDEADRTEESSGHIMYSSASSNFNAFNFYLNQPVLSQFQDTTNLHIVDQTDSAENILSRHWGSPAGCRFVRFNDLDYGNATKTSLQNAYEDGLKREEIVNVSVDDVIISKIQNKDTTTYFYVALKIIDIIDDPTGFDKDRYIFNVKK